MQTTTRVEDFSTAELIGDLCAPEGSRHWCIGMRFEIQKLLDQHETDHEQLKICVDAFTRYEGWKTVGNAKGKAFPCYSDFCKAKKPYGLGRDAGEIDALLKEGAAKTSQDKAANPETHPPLADPNTTGQHNRTVDIVNGRPTGNSSDYLVRRLKRDFPDIAAALARGEYKSARAAGIAAGIVKVPTPLEAARKAALKLTKTDLAEFKQWLFSLDGDAT